MKVTITVYLKVHIAYSSVTEALAKKKVQKYD